KDATRSPEAGSVLDVLQSLLDKSLINVVTTSSTPGNASGSVRYGMLETIRAYALERLEAQCQADVVRRGHALYYLAMAEQARPELTGPKQATWLAWID